MLHFLYSLGGKVGNHFAYDNLHLRHFLLHSTEDYVGVYLKVMVGYLVAHLLDTTPIDFRVVEQQLSMGLLVEPLDGLAESNKIHADGIEAHHAIGRTE